MVKQLLFVGRIMNDKSAQISFRPFCDADVPQYMKWAELPHVKNIWFKEGYEPKEMILEKVKGNGYDYPFAIILNDKPIGYIQCVDLHCYYSTHPDAKSTYYATEPEGTYCVDVFIGEPSCLNKGYGSIIVKKFTNWLMHWPEVKKILIDPSTENKRAIRCYEKAGFVFIRTAQGHVENNHHIMELKIKTPSSAVSQDHLT